VLVQQGNRDYLNLHEVTVEAKATYPRAKMSSTYKDSAYQAGAFQAENCINGDMESSSVSNMCHTTLENAPWLAIDFGQVVEVTSITIYNRKDDRWATGDRFRNAEVRVTDVLPTDGSEMFTGGQLLHAFKGPGTNGQVIQIQGEKDLRGRYTWH
jgi:hypothetical protein